MNKTIYIKDEDAQLWDRARELAHDRLSPIIVQALKNFVSAAEAGRSGAERIVVNYRDADSNGLPRSRAFFGRWIIPPNKPYKLTSEDGTEQDQYAVAITPKNNLVVYRRYIVDQGNYGNQTERLFVFNSFESGAADDHVRPAIIEARERLGVPTEELDI